MRTSARVGAWTLLEILMVMAIIAILTGITFGVFTGVRRRAADNRAKAELAAISTAVEAYRSHYGDYPWVVFGGTPPAGEILLNALAGKRGPTGVAMNGRVFLEPDRLTLSSNALPDPGNNLSVVNSFVDPWGSPYLYFFRQVGGNAADNEKWIQPILLSEGPDGDSDDPDAAGIVDYADDKNTDNVYAGRN